MHYAISILHWTKKKTSVGITKLYHFFDVLFFTFFWISFFNATFRKKISSGEYTYNNILICLQTHVFHHFQERKYILYYILYYILCQTKLASTKLGFLIDRSCVKERWWWKLNKYYSIHRVFSVKKSKEIQVPVYFWQLSTLK